MLWNFAYLYVTLQIHLGNPNRFAGFSSPSRSIASMFRLQISANFGNYPNESIKIFIGYG